MSSETARRARDPVGDWVLWTPAEATIDMRLKEGPA